MGQQAGGPNAALSRCLDELGWSPKALARKLNRVFGAGTVAESAPYHWRDGGSLPRSPLPMMAAYVLSQELGRAVSVAELWQGRAGDSSALVPADTDLARPWTVQGMEAIVEDWVMGGLVDRRRFLAISGAGLLAIVAQYLDGTAGEASTRPGWPRRPALIRSSTRSSSTCPCSSCSMTSMEVRDISPTSVLSSVLWGC